MISDAKSKIPRLLIIEKDSSLKEQFAATLANEYEFYTASSIDESLQVIKDQGIHGILLDISSLGREDGFLGTRRIKATNSNGKLPVIAMLPDADPSMKTDSLLAGCTTFIIKPVGAHALNIVITEVLNLTAAYRPQSSGT
jgi:DNA-binding response OmpR family regulator